MYIQFICCIMCLCVCVCTSRYNSGSKKFSEVTTTKHMSATIDAVTLYNSYWTKKKVEKKAPMGYC